jgi:RHS repeat-associated protein
LTGQHDTFGHETRSAYDGLDRPVEVTRAAGGISDDEVTKTEYFPGGEVRAVTNANGARTEHTLDGLNRIIATSTQLDGETLTTAAEYDGNGNKTFETDRRDVRRKNTYDELNRLTKVEVASGLSGEGPLGPVGAFGYDLVGNKTSETNLAGLTTRFVMDGLYRVKEKVLPEGPAPGESYRERFGYDKVGNRTSFTDANGHATSFEYDGLNRLIRTTNALDEVTTVTYQDPEGSKVNKSEEHDLVRGLRTSFGYDLLNRETSRVVRLEGAGSAGEVYTTATSYDDGSHTLTVIDPRGTPTRTVLNGLDRVIETTVDPSGLNLVTRVAYDGLGNRKSVTDPEDHTTLYRHDGLGRLAEVTDAKSQKTAYTYDGEGLKLSETDRRDVTKRFSYDNLGRPRATTLVPSLSGVGWSHDLQYRDIARKRIEIDGRGHTTTFDLDGLERVVKVTDPLGFAQGTAYDGVNRVSETDKRGNTTSFQYDALNRLTRTADPVPFEAQTQETTYDDAANKRTEKDQRAILKVTQADPLGRVITVTRAKGTADEAVLETNAYDGNGNRTSQTDAEGRVIRLAYDPANRLKSRTEGFGTAEAATTTFEYDRAGNQAEEKDQRATDLGEPWSVKKTYDELNRLETLTDGEGDVTTYGYDAEGNRTSAQEPMGQVTRFAYDELGKLTKVTQPAVPAGVPVTDYGYDENRNRTKQTDANGHVVEMTYDELNRMTSMAQDPGGFGYVTRHEYDPNGNETKLTDPKGQVVTTIYDELNRLKTRTYAFASSDPARPWRHTASMAYAYDENNNLTRADEQVASGSDPPGTTLTTTRAFDKLDRLLSETVPLPDGGFRTVGHTYYRNGLRKTVTDPSGLVTFYDYDGQNRLRATTTGQSTPQAGTTTQTYWPDDLLRSVTYPNGVTATHGYDKADRLTSLVNAKAASVVSSYGYTYDGNGNRKSQSEANGGTTEATTYTYDALDRLETVTYPGDGTFPNGRVVSYGYDAVGNRIRETEKDSGGVVLADKQGIFDSLNRLTALSDLVVPPNSTAFTWDANGNQMSKTVGTGPTAVTTEYRYDVRDKLVEVDQGVSILGRLQYCYDGKRIKKIGEEGVRQYVYDQTSLLTEYDAAGVEKAKYDYGSDRLIALTRADEGRRFFSFDGLRSVVNLTNETGSTAASYHLDAWGNFRFPAELLASRNRFAFTGYEWDPELGLFNAKARYFDPQLGRFLSQDSFLGQIDEPPSLHRYFYANANPTRYVDPTGHAAGDVWDPRSYDWKVFGQEFGTRLGETGANIATLGGYGGIKRGFEEGRITGTDFGSAGRAYAEGVFNTITLGGGERAIGAYAEGKGAGGVAVEGVKGAGETVLPINEIKAIADPSKSAWEKAEAIATATTKVASLTAGGLAARNALTQRAAARAAVATESAAGAEATLAPTEGALPPVRPLPRVAGGSPAADVAQTAEQAALRQRVLANIEEIRAGRRQSGGFSIHADRSATVRTPHGVALQDTSPTALALRQQVLAGRQIFRGGNYPRSLGPEGQYWGFENPLTPGYAQRTGAATLGASPPDFIMGGQLRPDANFVVRRAPPYGANPGGAWEVVVETGGTRTNYFSSP